MRWSSTWWVSRSFIAEQIALNDPVNDITGSIGGAARFFEDFLNLLPVREADGSAGSISGKLADQVSRHGSLFVIEQELFELANVMVGAAVGEGAGGIDRQRSEARRVGKECR